MESMTRTTLLVACIAVVLLVVACGSSRTVIDPPATVTGQIMLVGNEPFTHLALIVDPRKSYLIECDSTTKQLLLSNQGRLANLVYNEIRKTDRGEELNVLSATIRSK
jgi:hypothetical protein